MVKWSLLKKEFSQASTRNNDHEEKLDVRASTIRICSEGISYIKETCIYRCRSHRVEKGKVNSEPMYCCMEEAHPTMKRENSHELEVCSERKANP